MQQLARIPSLGGGQLPGTNIVRMVFMDEAGRGHLDREPFFVAACVIINPDKQWHELRRYYTDLANDVFEDFSSDDYVFQAKHVWHGSGDFQRSEFSREQRMKILLRLSQVPKLFGLPICVGVIDRQAVANWAKSPAPNIRLEHALGYAVALQHVDSWLVEHLPNEVATVTAEDTDQVKEAVSFFHEGAKKTDHYDDYWDRGVFKTRAIVDTINYAPKDKSPLLQIADHCAFITKRRAMGCPKVTEMWSNIAPQLWKENRHKGSQLEMRVPMKYIKTI
jgi:hypothetical protein